MMDCKISGGYWSDGRQIFASSDREAISAAKKASESQNLTPFRVRIVHRSDEQVIHDSRKDIS
jgi:hypothetical protein